MPARKLSEPKTSNNSRSIRLMFDSIAPAYDRFNSWASLGLHHRWRKTLISRIPAHSRVLDIATGTGDVAFLAAEAGHEAVGLDFSERMLEGARAKDKRGRLKWINGSADRLPFSDRSFGCITSAFALRNLRGCLDKVFAENARVLKTGGRVLHMDFGRPSSGLPRLGHRVHLQYGVPAIGQLICGQHWPKGYLETTIQEFYEPIEVKKRLEAVGFTDVTNTPLLWGSVQIYEGIKV